LEGPLGLRLARRVVPMAGMSAGAVFLVLGVVAREPAVIVACFALALGGVGMAEGPFWITAIDLGGRRGGSAAGFLNTGGNVGGMLAPVITPVVGRVFGWGPAVALAALVCACGVVLWLGVRADESPGTPNGLPLVGP
jgi:MFS family permease